MRRDELGRDGRIGQVAWGIPCDPTSVPPIFPVYRQATGFSEEGNARVLDVAFGKGRVVAHGNTFEEAVQKAYGLARAFAGPDAIDRTSRGADLDNPDPLYRLWYTATWSYEI